MDGAGLLVAGVGLPGVGKSTLLAEVARTRSWAHFSEPRESLWPQAASSPEKAGAFTALSWFRVMRVSNLFAADEVRHSGRVAVVDSYYDRLMTYYIRQPGMRWLIAEQDPYFQVAADMAAVDNSHLPAADIIVFIRATLAHWEKLILSRSRQLDLSHVYPAAFVLQDYLQDAVTQESQRRGTRVLYFDNEFGSIQHSVAALNRAVDDLMRHV